MGECGLDYDRMFSSREAQLLCFERHAALAVELTLTLTLTLTLPLTRSLTLSSTP